MQLIVSHFSIVRFYLYKQVPLFRTSARTAVNLSYKIIGEGSFGPDEPPLLILHALLDSKKRWESIGKTIVNMTKRSVVAVDLRNHGDSPHINSHKYEDLSSDVLQLYERLGIERADIIGHDTGARSAMCLSLKTPKKVASLLLVDMSPVSTPTQYKDDFQDILKSMKSVDFKSSKTTSKAIKGAKRQLKKVIKDDTIMSTVLSNIRVLPDGSVGWRCNLDVLMKHFKHIASFPKPLKAKKYYGPTFFIGGQFSEFLPADDLIAIREMFPNAVINYVPRAGHYVHVDDPKTFLELAIAFLRTNSMSIQ